MTQLPIAVGVGLRGTHYRDFLADQAPAVPWLEAHSENYFGGGAALHTLMRIRERYPISLHGVGMGLASADGLDADHLRELQQLVATVQPAAVSEHLSWNRSGGQVINDLLPFPYTAEALELVARNVDQVQQALGCAIAVENLSSYVRFRQTAMSEAEFLAALVERTGCKILLDVNNIYVNQVNLGIDARQFMRALPVGQVAEIHLAGFSTLEDCLVDSHSQPVCAEVWLLYAEALQRFGALPTLLEWDIDIPPLTVLMQEADKAQQILQQAGAWQPMNREQKEHGDVL
ncbi:hypothetical protein WH50_23665 [Pokkaliibacter plantistimulans]|uniref:Uncharacterized protein n=1 Tax=Pokkaliibacter plantistimulans TaxID=1635171 RepID=A0ABX5LUC3_9GAMM|nr:DUF692 domain-containing protein [Pokkaliibacter plantistimulans]PXF28881.1 hypothetical protein WH50_23665 [Pokkaliibacter plantistimulans]